MSNTLQTIDITYRGPLASCNYDCDYCPFAKTHDDAEKRKQDQLALESFVAWVKSRQDKDKFRILFTPWGEALVRKWYRKAMLELSWMPHVVKVVMQTNLSSPTHWMEESNTNSIALWTTYHPEEIKVDKFVEYTQKLSAMGVSYSVGIVGKKDNKKAIEKLRKLLNPDVYLWINAYKDQPDYYSDKDKEFFCNMDPLFMINNENYLSKGKQCRAATKAISVDGNGDVRPCNFVDEISGNIYRHELHSLLKNKYYCPNNLCDCYIGYIHLSSLKLHNVYGDRILERIPIEQI